MTTETAWGDQKPHIITITCDAADDTGACTCDAEEVEHDWTITVECPGRSATCRTWWECQPCSSAIAAGDMALLDQLYETSEAHGVEHYNHHDIGWSTAGGDCWVQVSDDLQDAVHEMFPKSEPVAGTFSVYVEDGDPLTLSLVTEDAAVTA